MTVPHVTNRVALAVAAIAVTAVLAGCGASTTRPTVDQTEQARDAAEDILSEIRSGDQLEASTDAAMKSATERCADGRGAPDSGEPAFDEAVAAAMKLLCP